MLDLISFSPKLTALSNIYASRTLDNNPEDVYQEMALALLEKAEDPQFENQTESYITHAARMRAWTLARDCKISNSFQTYVSDDPEAEDAWYDEIASSEPTPEDVLIRKQELTSIVAAMRFLSGREREVISLVVRGVKPGDIASQIGCSPAAVSVYKARAAEKIRKVVLS